MNTVLKIIVWVLLISSIVSVQAQDNKRINVYKAKHQENRALVQYYRWFQVFEIPQNEKRISNHMEILSDSVKIVTNLGTQSGEDGMKGFLSYVKDWKNMHHIEQTNFNSNDDGTFTLDADIVYQNTLPDGKMNTYKLHYTTHLETGKTDIDLPIFTSLELLPTETITPAVFIDAYPKNRSTAFIYYWFSLIDNFDTKKDVLKQLIASHCNLNVFDKKASNPMEFIEIMTTALKDIKIGMHTPMNIEVTEKGDDTFAVSFDIEWLGLGYDGREITGKVHNDWILENDANDKFAKIKEMYVEMIEPYRVVGE